MGLSNITGIGSGVVCDSLDASKLGLDGFEDGLGLHDHAGASAVRVVIDDPVLVLGVVPDVVEVDVDQTPVPGALYDAFADRAVKHAGE